jgi:hypothetical protein
LASSRPKWAGGRQRATKNPAKKPWYKRTTARVLAALGAIGVSVATTLATGIAQKLVGVDSPASSSAPSANASVAVKNAAPAPGNPLVRAKATVVEDPDYDVWVADGPVSLTPDESARIQSGKTKGAEQGDLQEYLRDMTKIGAVKTDTIAIDLNLSTQIDDQVRIDRIRADSRCRAPLAGSIFYSPSAGPAVPIGKIGFDLDSPTPVARKLTEHEGQQTFGSDFFANNVQYIKKGDGFAYRVVVQSKKRYCEFQLKIDASVNGNSQTMTVGDLNGPFRVSGQICGPSTAVAPCPKFSAYKRTYSGGVANPQGDGRWIPKDSATYGGG